MAHKGKLWPLMLRRDLYLNTLTYQYGFAEEYILTPRSTFGTVGDVYDGTPARCSNPIVSAGGVCTWSSPEQHIFSYRVHLELIAEILNFPQDNFMRWQAVLDDGTIIFARQYFSHSADVPQGGDMSSFATSTVQTAGVFFDLGGSGGEYGPVAWGA